MNANEYTNLKKTGKKVLTAFGFLLIASNTLFAQQAVANTVKKKATQVQHVTISTSTHSAHAKTAKTVKPPVSQMVSPTKNTQNKTTTVQKPKKQSEKSGKIKTAVKEAVKEVVKEEIASATGTGKETEGETKKEKKPTSVIVLELGIKLVGGLITLSGIIIGYLKWKKGKDDKKKAEQEKENEKAKQEPVPADVSLIPILEEIKVIKANAVPPIGLADIEIWFTEMLESYETQRKMLKVTIDNIQDKEKKECEELKAKAMDTYNKKLQYISWRSKTQSAQGKGKEKAAAEIEKTDALKKVGENLQEILTLLKQKEVGTNQYLVNIFPIISRSTAVILSEIKKIKDEKNKTLITEITENTSYFEYAKQNPGITKEMVCDEGIKKMTEMKNKGETTEIKVKETEEKGLTKLKAEVAAQIKRYYPNLENISKAAAEATAGTAVETATKV